MFKKYIYNVDFNLSKEKISYQAWHEAKGAKGRSELINEFKNLCKQNKLPETTEEFNSFILSKFIMEIEQTGISDDVRKTIKVNEIKEAEDKYICVIDYVIDYENSVFKSEKEALDRCRVDDDGCWILKEKIMPAGTYFVGDPLCVIKEEHEYLMEVSPSRSIFVDTNGIHFGMFDTYMGDGVFKDDEGREYPVDSGRIAILPISLCNQDKIKNKGEVFEISTPFTAEWEPEDGSEGDICIANIFIHTDPGWPEGN